jgi:hypothetical protein
MYGANMAIIAVIEIYKLSHFTRGADKYLAL